MCERGTYHLRSPTIDRTTSEHNTRREVSLKKRKAEAWSAYQLCSGKRDPHERDRLVATVGWKEPQKHKRPAGERVRRTDGLLTSAPFARSARAISSALSASSAHTKYNGVHCGITTAQPVSRAGFASRVIVINATCPYKVNTKKLVGEVERVEEGWGVVMEAIGQVRCVVSCRCMGEQAYLLRGRARTRSKRKSRRG